MTAGRVDVHAHLLPAIDDGCPTIQDSLACARTFVEAGYSHVCCTPHIWPSLPDNTIASIRRDTLQLQARLESAGIPLRLIPGGEINLQSAWPALKDMPAVEIASYGFAGRYVLFDFWADTLPECIEPGVMHLKSLGMTCVLAHPERIAAFQSDPAAIDRVMEMGVLLQLNTWTLAESASSITRKVAERWLKQGRYFVFGTDCHNFAGMASRIKGLRLAMDLVGEAEVRRLTETNPRTLLPEAAFTTDIVRAG